MRETNEEEGVSRQGWEIIPKTVARATKKDGVLGDQDVRRWFENIATIAP